jgi:hypothetical protein
MKALGKSSLSSKIKFILDSIWYLGCAGVVLWAVVAFFLLAGNLSCPQKETCTSGASIDSIGFKLDPKSVQLLSPDGSAAYFSEGSGKLMIKGPLSKTTAVAIVLEGTFLGFLFLLSIAQLRKLFKTFAQGVPFAESNVRTLKFIALSIFGISVFSGLFSVLNAFLLNQQYTGEGIRLVANSSFDISSLFAASVIYILAEIFSLGSRLEDEQAHTV